MTRNHRKNLHWLTLSLLGCLVFPDALDAQCTTREYGKLSPADRSSAGFAGTLAFQGTDLFIGAPFDSDAESQAGQVYVCRLQGDVFVSGQRLQPRVPAAGDQFGGAVALDGDALVVGSVNRAHGSLARAGAAFVFRRQGSMWLPEQTLTRAIPIDTDDFANSVAIHGDVIVVGAPAELGRGAAHVFLRQGGTWTKVQELRGPFSSHRFGCSLSIQGNLIAVGAMGDELFGTEKGSVFLFRHDGVMWNLEQELTASDGQSKDAFGHSVSLDLDRVAVGAWGDDDFGDQSGSAYIFHFDGATWNEEQKLTASDAGQASKFGWTVSLADDHVVVGAPIANAKRGRAYLFRNTGATWEQQWTLLASSREQHDRFGTSTAIEGSRVIVGATGADQGKAYLFRAPDLALTISPTHPRIGRTVTLESCAGVPTTPVQLFVTAIAGIPTFIPTPALGVYDASGQWSLSGPLLGSPGPIDVTFRALSVDAASRIIRSNPAVVAFP